MKTLSFLLTMGMTAATCTALAEPAVTHYRYRHEAGWANTSTSFECGGGTIDMWAAEEATRTGPGAPETTAIAHVSYSTYSYCTGASSFGQADLPLQHGINMNGMAVDFAFTVQNTVTTYDPENGYVTEELAPSTLTGSITLTGDGPISVGKSRSFATGFSGTQVSMYSGKERSATALFTAVLDGQPLQMGSAAGGLVSTNSGVISSASQSKFIPRLPSPPVAGNPASTTIDYESRGGMANLRSGDDSGCIRSSLDISAFDGTVSSLPDGSVEASNGGYFTFSRSDSCDPGVVHELNIDGYMADATQITPTLVAVAFSIDEPVRARRCTWVVATGDYQCTATTVQLRADLLWEGVGDVVGGSSVGSYRSADSFERDENARYARLADLTQSFVVDGEPAEFSDSDSTANVWTQSFIRTTTPRL